MSRRDEPRGKLLRAPRQRHGCTPEGVQLAMDGCAADATIPERIEAAAALRRAGLDARRIAMRMGVTRTQVGRYLARARAAAAPQQESEAA